MNNITFVKGNIFNTKAQTVVNTVNCVGVMGKGIALVYKLRYPKMFDIYKEYCHQHLIGIGKLWIYKGDKMILGCLISQLNSIGNIRANMNMSRKVFKNLLKHILAMA